MASITGKDGYVTHQATGVDTIVAGIREWSIDYTCDMIEVTAFAVAGADDKAFMPSLHASTGSFVGNITDGAETLDVGTAYNLMLAANSDRAYYGSCIIKSKGSAVTVDGEAIMTFTFETNGKLYVLGADVVVDGDFTAATSAAWDVTDADVACDTTGDQLDFSGDADVVPASNTLLTAAIVYFTQILLENEAGTTTCAIKLGTTSGTSRTTDGTYTEFITAQDVDFTISVTTDSALSVSELIIRPVLN